MGQIDIALGIGEVDLLISSVLFLVCDGNDEVSVEFPHIRYDCWVIVANRAWYI